MNAIEHDVVLTRRDADVCRTLIREHLDETGAIFASVIHQSGNVLAQVGDPAYQDSGEIGALTAGSMAAIQGLAERLGETSMHGVSYQGSGRHFFVCAAGPELLLLTAFGRHATLGIVRASSVRCANELKHELKSRAERQSDDDVLPLLSPSAGRDWATVDLSAPSR